MKREALYLGEGEGSFFGWYHAEEAAAPADRVAVICGPLGHEYTRAHRTLRHLADRLARAGIPALRFDYHGIGDSAGSDLDQDRVATWLGNIELAVERARALSGRASVVLIGVRLGASLAALASRALEIDDLVLWNPALKGKAYVRELQAIAASAARATTVVEGALESAGSVMTAQTLESVRAIDLVATPPAARRVLVVGRDDVAPDTTLVELLLKEGIAAEYVRLPGWSAMMAEHQFTVVPEEALAIIVDRVGARSAPAAPRGEAAVAANCARFHVPSPGGAVKIEEQWCRFGADKHLVGVLSRATPAKDRPAVVIFNAGAVHRVGPNRVGVTLAREFAAAGFACLRFDLEGIGDSVLRAPGRENHPYPDTAIADAKAAFDFLRREFGYTRFIPLGLCSGAHNTFHAGLQLADHSICELVLINPLTFYWEEGMSLDTTRHFEDAIQYKKSMRDPGRWLKLLRGGVNMPRLAQTVVGLALAKLAAQRDALREILSPAAGPRLSRDLRRLLAMNRPLSFFIAEGDPGREILMTGAKRTAMRALRSGQIAVEMIPDADHTFSQLKPRAELVRRLKAHLMRHLAEPAREPQPIATGVSPSLHSSAPCPR